MRCPSCGSLDTQVKDSRPTDDNSAIRRRRFCPACGSRFTTFERVQLRELIVKPEIYAAADLAFVGGSLLPFGRHNVLEPAMLGRPVLVGPHTFNFSDIVRLLEQAGVLRVVADAEQLAAAARAWLEDSNERDRVGRLARDIVQRHRGATQRTVGEIERLLLQASAPEAANRVA